MTMIYRLLGEAMQPDRWERCQRLYREAGAPAVFTTYRGDRACHERADPRDIAQFFRTAMARPAEQ